MRFGLDGYAEHTYLDLGYRMKRFHSERARQIELRAIRKLEGDDVLR